MSRWWRAYDEAVDDPKLCLLSDRQHRVWFNLCCITSQNGGRLPPIAAVAFKLRMTVPKAKSAVAELVALGLVDMDDAGVCQPHNWDSRQYKTDVTDPTTANRSKRYRDRKRDATRDDDRDAAVTVTDTRAETEQRQNAAPAAPDPEVELFRRGREVLGKAGGGLVSKLLIAKQKNIPLARAAIEQASTKSDPREYIGAVIRGPQKGNEPNWLDGIPGVI